MKEESVVADGAGRLDQFLARRFPTYSRCYLKNMILDNRIRVNGTIRAPDFRLAGGEVIHVRWEDRVWKEVPFEDWVLHEDADLLAINKPTGILVHPMGASWLAHSSVALEDVEPNIAGLMLKYRAQAASSGVSRCGIVHRLDRETSGVLLIAKTPMSQERLLTAFRDREVHKVYRAIVLGELKKATVEAPVGRLVGRRLIAAIPWGKEASTEFKPLAAAQGLSLVQAEPRTGRTHQIRAHLAFLKSPVMGDAQWFKTPELKRLKELKVVQPPRMMLHAYRIRFTHPKTGRKVSITAPLPKDFMDYCKSAGLK